MASRVVKIKRRANTTNLPEEVYAESKRQIGSEFTSSGNIYTGLTQEEIIKYMPEVINIPTNDTSFRSQVNEYFKNLTLRIDAGKGLSLEIGTDKNGDPLNVVDYVRYKFAKNHSEVRHRRNYLYYIEDPQEVKKKRYASAQLRSQAYREAIKLTSDDEDKINMIIRLFGSDPSKMDEEDKTIYLDEKASEDPQHLLDIVNDKHLETRAFIEEARSKQVLRKVGNAIFFIDDKIGNDEDETIVFIEDPKNSETVMTIKAKLQAFDS